jgi:hypothetical protein
VFGADIIADDWIPMIQQVQLKLLTDRLTAAGKGIVLLHDPEAQTADMLADFLRYLRDNRYRVVHVMPRTAATAAANVRQDEKRE